MRPGQTYHGLWHRCRPQRGWCAQEQGRRCQAWLAGRRTTRRVASLKCLSPPRSRRALPPADAAVRAPPPLATVGLASSPACRLARTGLRTATRPRGRHHRHHSVASIPRPPSDRGAHSHPLRGSVREARLRLPRPHWRGPKPLRLRWSARRQPRWRGLRMCCRLWSAHWRPRRRGFSRPRLGLPLSLSRMRDRAVVSAGRRLAALARPSRNRPGW